MDHINKILAIDLYSVAFRYFSVKPEDEDWTYRKTIQAINHAVDEIRPSHTIICSEGSQECFRREIDENYKWNRNKPPQVLLDQIARILSQATSQGFIVVDPLDCEADDALASIAAQSPEDSVVLIMTRDKDLFACINDRVSVFHRDQEQYHYFDENGCIEKFGVHPKRMTEYLSLIGDCPDNISGVAGLGPKKAQEIIFNYDSVFDAIMDPDRLSPAIAKKLVAGRNSFNLSYQLVNLRTDLALPGITPWRVLD